MSFDHDLIFCAKKKTGEPYASDKDGSRYGFAARWGVYNQDFELIIADELDEEVIVPMIKESSRGKPYGYQNKYFVLRKGKLAHGIPVPWASFM